MGPRACPSSLPWSFWGHRSWEAACLSLAWGRPKVRLGPKERAVLGGVPWGVGCVWGRAGSAVPAHSQHQGPPQRPLPVAPPGHRLCPAGSVLSRGTHLLWNQIFLLSCTPPRPLGFCKEQGTHWKQMIRSRTLPLCPHLQRTPLPLPSEARLHRPPPANVDGNCF